MAPDINYDPRRQSVAPGHALGSGGFGTLRHRPRRPSAPARLGRAPRLLSVMSVMKVLKARQLLPLELDSLARPGLRFPCPLLRPIPPSSGSLGGPGRETEDRPRPQGPGALGGGGGGPGPPPPPR